MMIAIYRSEMLKLRHTKIHWAVLIPAILANLVSLVMLLPKVTLAGETIATSMNEVFYRQGNMITILGPFMFALIAGYIFSREYSDRTINQLFTYPISRSHIFMAKLSVIFTLIIITSTLSCTSALLVGTIKVLSGEIGVTLILKGIGMNLSACFLAFGTIPVAVAFGITARSIIPPMVLGAFASFVTLILEIGHSMSTILFPWATPYYLVREFGEGFSEMGANPYAGTALIILLITFATSIAFCLWRFTRSEIHSGS